MEETDNIRDFSSVSPSARWMILLKGHTDIPYAREVAELLEYPGKYTPDFKNKDFTFWACTLGLERRYRSIDQLINDLCIKNILELSSGFSFRGLHYTQKDAVHYIDTDLPEIISTKRKIYENLRKDETNPPGKFELFPLNVLDRTNFQKIKEHFPDGEILIVNEGLLSYLVKHEQEALCGIIHDILMDRGGYWITGDIGLKNKEGKLGLNYTDEIRKFNEQQNTEENSFGSFMEAEQFFSDMGFVIDKEARTKYSEMSSFKYLKKSITLRQLFKMRDKGNIIATWRLKAV